MTQHNFKRSEIFSNKLSINTDEFNDKGKKCRKTSLKHIFTLIYIDFSHIYAFNILTPPKEDKNEDNCISKTRISEVNIQSVSQINQTKESKVNIKIFDEDVYESEKSKECSKAEVTKIEEEHALGLIMSMNSDSNLEDKKEQNKIEKHISKISVTSSIDCKPNLYIISIVVESGLKNVKNRITTNNLIDKTNNLLQIQYVNSLLLNGGRKKSIKGINLNSNNFNNIININFNKFEGGKNETKEENTLNLNNMIVDEKYLRIFYEFIYATIRFKSGCASSIDKEEIYKELSKDSVPFYNYSEIIQDYFKKNSVFSNSNDEKNSNKNLHPHRKRKIITQILSKRKVHMIRNKFYSLLKLRNKSKKKKFNNNIFNKKIVEGLKISSMENQFMIPSVKMSYNSDSNLKSQNFQIYITNSIIYAKAGDNINHTLDMNNINLPHTSYPYKNPNENNQKEQKKQIYSEGLKSLYTKYFKYSDNFLNDTMKMQSQIKNFNHLYPNSKWSKYVSKHHKCATEENPEINTNFGLVKLNPQGKNCYPGNSRINSNFIPKMLPNTPKYLNFMHTQYYYSMLLNKKKYEVKNRQRSRDLNFLSLIKK